MVHVRYVDSGYSGKGTYRPVISAEGTSSWERVRSRMVRDTSLSEADVDRVMARFAETIGEELLEGSRVPSQPGASETRIGSYLRTGSRYLDVRLALVLEVTGTRYVND